MPDFCSFMVHPRTFCGSWRDKYVTRRIITSRRHVARRLKAVDAQSWTQKAPFTEMHPEHLRSSHRSRFTREAPVGCTFSGSISRQHELLCRAVYTCFGHCLEVAVSVSESQHEATVATCSSLSTTTTVITSKTDPLFASRKPWPTSCEKYPAHFFFLGEKCPTCATKLFLGTFIFSTLFLHPQLRRPCTNNDLYRLLQGHACRFSACC